MPPREATRERDEPPAPKKPRTEGSRTGQRKGKKKKSRGGKRSPSGGGQWNPHHGRKKYAAHPAPATTEQPEPKRSRAAASAAYVAIVAQAEDEQVETKLNFSGVLTEAGRRQAIAQTYIDVFGAASPVEWESIRSDFALAGAPADKNGWVKGTIRRIAEHMKMHANTNKYRDIKAVLVRVRECAREHTPYDGKRAGDPVKRRIGGLSIKPGSLEEQLVADFAERGLSMAKICDEINTHLTQAGRPHIGVSSVYTAYLNLDAEETIIKKRKQCGGEAWALAGWRWVAQKMIRLGLEIPDEHKPWDINKPTPPEFDLAKLGPLSVHQIVAFDECDKKVVFDGLRAHSSHARKQIRIRRDADGKVDLLNGTLRAERTELQCKYLESSRYCYGGASVQLADETVVGKRCEELCFSGRWIHTPASHREVQGKEIRRVKGLKGKQAPWVIDSRPAGVLHVEEDLFVKNRSVNIKEVAEKTVEKLAAAFATLTPPREAKTVADIKRLTKPEREHLLAAPNGSGKNKQAQARSSVERMSKVRLQEIFDVADAALDGAANYVVDYTAAENPYQARFANDPWVPNVDGMEKWEFELNNSHFMSSQMHVYELWEYCMRVSATVMKGTKHEDDWVIDHDALIQLTNNETIEWMKHKIGPNGVSYYNRWLLPKLNLNTGDYDGRPVGNHPEHMPWDSSLNKDVDDCVRFQVSCTAGLHDDDPKKFLLSTPHNQDKAYARVMDPSLGPDAGAPLGKRIVQDFAKCYGVNLEMIVMAHGWAVEGVGTRDGHRRDESYFGPLEIRLRMAKIVKPKFLHGGLRIKNATPKEAGWKHPDAESAMKDAYKESVDAHNQAPYRVRAGIMLDSSFWCV
jgi:hypothetical protein